MKTADFEIRTDLALEEREGLKEQAKEVSGVSFRKWKGKSEEVQITEVKVLNEAGAKALGKPVGTYLTLEADRLLLPDEDFHSEISDELAAVLKRLAEQALKKPEKEEKEKNRQSKAAADHISCRSGQSECNPRFPGPAYSRKS